MNKTIRVGLTTLLIAVLVVFPALAEPYTYRDGDWLITVNEEKGTVTFELYESLFQRLLKFLAVYPSGDSAAIIIEGKSGQESWSGYTITVGGAQCNIDTGHQIIPFGISGAATYNGKIENLNRGHRDKVVIYDSNILISGATDCSRAYGVTRVSISFTKNVDFVCNPSDTSLRCDNTYTKVIECSEDGRAWNVLESCSYRCENGVCLVAPTPTPRPTPTIVPTPTPTPYPTPVLSPTPTPYPTPTPTPVLPPIEEPMWIQWLKNLWNQIREVFGI